MEDVRIMLWTFGLFYVHFIYFMAVLYTYVVEIWHIFPPLVNCTKKSGNPAFSVIKSAPTFVFSGFCRKLQRQFAKRRTQKRREMQAAKKSWSPQVPMNQWFFFWGGGRRVTPFFPDYSSSWFQHLVNRDDWHLLAWPLTSQPMYQRCI
jgi:hypothetical protein